MAALAVLRYATPPLATAQCGLTQVLALKSNFMATDRFVRWQGLAITQLSVAVALLSGLSIAGIGAGLSLLQKPEFSLAGLFKVSFAASLLLFVVTAFCSCGAVLTRLLDFRLTARKARGKSQLKIFRRDSDAYSRATWRLFWVSCVCFLTGASLLVASVGSAYLHRLL